MGIYNFGVCIAWGSSFSIHPVLLWAISQENVETSKGPEPVFLTLKEQRFNIFLFNEYY